jgi:glycosyltransferase involved in cell wall biosynthesis
MRILFLSPWFPYPSVNGSKIRIYHLLRELSRQHEVHLVSFTRPGEVVERSGLEGICASIETVAWREFNPRGVKAWLGLLSLAPRSVLDTYSRSMRSLVLRRARELQPEVLVASELDTAPYAAAIEGRVVRIFDDLEVGLIRTLSQQAGSPLGRLRGRLSWLKARWYVRRLLRHFDACTVVSAPEQKILSQVAVGYNRVYQVPNGVDVRWLQPGLAEAQPGALIYTGSLTFRANYDAVRYFLNEIYPLIQAQSPQVSLKVTGSVEGVDLSSLPAREGVTFTGFLPDIRPVVASAWACVTPLRMGGGTRLKILEAMALGTPVISTTLGAEGLQVTPGEDILVADTPQAFADQVVRLLGDSDLRTHLSRNGRRLVENHYSWEYLGMCFEQMLQSVIQARTIP